jgi:hypothetical protein
MSAQKKSELEKLLEWMKVEGHDYNSLAAAVGMSHDGVYQILYVRKRISPGFKVRFTERFKEEVSKTIFDPLIINEVA